MFSDSVESVYTRAINLFRQNTKQSEEKLKKLAYSYVKGKDRKRKPDSKLFLSPEDAKVSKRAETCSPSFVDEEAPDEETDEDINSASAEEVMVEEVQLSSHGLQDLEKLAAEMGIDCAICGSMTVTAGNRLLECSDCHTLYHQNCHKPTVSDTSANDPRTVWICSNCSKKAVSVKQEKPEIKIEDNDNTVLIDESDDEKSEDTTTAPETLDVDDNSNGLFSGLQAAFGKPASTPSKSGGNGLKLLSSQLENKAKTLPSTSQAQNTSVKLNHSFADEIFGVASVKPKSVSMSNKVVSSSKLNPPLSFSKNTSVSSAAPASDAALKKLKQMKKKANDKLQRKKF